MQEMADGNKKVKKPGDAKSRPANQLFENRIG